MAKYIYNKFQFFNKQQILKGILFNIIYMKTLQIIKISRKLTKYFKTYLFLKYIKKNIKLNNYQSYLLYCFGVYFNTYWALIDKNSYPSSKYMLNFWPRNITDPIKEKGYLNKNEYLNLYYDRGTIIYNLQYVLKNAYITILIPLTLNLYYKKPNSLNKAFYSSLSVSSFILWWHLPFLLFKYGLIKKLDPIRFSITSVISGSICYLIESKSQKQNLALMISGGLFS